MTEADLHVPEPAESEAHAERPKRASTILARLTKAVREQSWFAVVLELLIVIMGVVVGFQITAWGQRQTDRAKEERYLRQLAADLRETQNEFEEASAWASVHDLDVVQLLRSTASAAPVPQDSLAVWLSGVYGIAVVDPVIATAEALVATGDLSLIRDDSLRSSITRYLQSVRRSVRIQEFYADQISSHSADLYERFDPNALVVRLRSPQEMDSIARENPFATYPESPRRPIAPLDVRALLAQRETTALLRRVASSKHAMRSIRAGSEASAVGLLEQVEAQIDG